MKGIMMNDIYMLARFLRRRHSMEIDSSTNARAMLSAPGISVANDAHSMAWAIYPSKGGRIYDPA